MNRQQLMEQAEESLKLMILKSLAGSEQTLMATAVESFFNDKVSVLSRSEILDHFSTPGDALNFFMMYLNERITNHFSSVISELNGSTTPFLNGVQANA